MNGRMLLDLLFIAVIGLSPIAAALFAFNHASTILRRKFPMLNRSTPAPTRTVIQYQFDRFVVTREVSSCGSWAPIARAQVSAGVVFEIPKARAWDSAAFQVVAQDAFRGGSR